MQTIEPLEVQETVALSDYEKERGKPMPNITHGIIEARQSAILSADAKGRYNTAVELTLEFADGSVLTPDIAVLPKRPIAWGREPVRCRDLPLLTVEILSPSQGYLSALEKIDTYFAQGVQSVWEVNPALKLIVIHQPGHPDPQIVLHGAAVDPATGLSASLEEVFAE